MTTVGETLFSLLQTFLNSARFEGFGASRMAIFVIDFLEMVQVGHKQGSILSIVLGAHYFRHRKQGIKA